MDYDVIVLGGGPAGIAAAVSSAKCGARTLLVEKNGTVGGMGTSGLLNVWCGSSSSGFFRKVRAKTTQQRGRRSVFSPEALKSCYLAELEAAGAELLLHATYCGVHRRGTTIDSVQILGAGETFPLRAKVYIDATGDGFLAKDAGVPYCKGRETDHRMQPMSLIFSVGGVEESRAVYPSFGTHPDLEQKMQDYVARGRIDSPAGHVILIQGFHPGTANVNMTNLVGLDPTKAEDLTRAELLTRRQVPQIVEFLRECVPGYENCFLLQTAQTVGARESLHFVGDYRLTEQDILAQRVFDDWVVSNAAFSFDTHSLTGSGKDPSCLKYHGERYTIPYRCLLPQGVDNLLLAGRNISGTHMAHSSFRVMPICMGMGEGAGVAAALAVREGIPLRQVDPKAIQAILLQTMEVEPPCPVEGLGDPLPTQ